MTLSRTTIRSSSLPMAAMSNPRAASASDWLAPINTCRSDRSGAVTIGSSTPLACAKIDWNSWAAYTSLGIASLGDHDVPTRQLGQVDALVLGGHRPRRTSDECHTSEQVERIILRSFGQTRGIPKRPVF